MTSNANTSGLDQKPPHMSDELFEVWRKIQPGPDYAPYRIASAEARACSAEARATAAEARVAELEAAKWEAKHADTMNDLVAMGLARDAAEARADRLAKALEEIAAIEAKPFEGGLDMEAIRSCDECRRYEGHPVQHGICNTHMRPIWDREKHDAHEKATLGYRAKSIARAALQQEPTT